MLGFVAVDAPCSWASLAFLAAAPLPTPLVDAGLRCRFAAEAFSRPTRNQVIINEVYMIII